MRQTFRQVPRDLEDAARIDGCNWLGILRTVYIPPSVPALVSFSLVSISAHWNEFLWPLIVTNNNTRPLTIGLTQILQTNESGAAVLIVIALLCAILAFLAALYQRLCDLWGQISMSLLEKTTGSLITLPYQP